MKLIQTHIRPNPQHAFAGTKRKQPESGQPMHNRGCFLYCSCPAPAALLQTPTIHTANVVTLHCTLQWMCRHSQHQCTHAFQPSILAHRSHSKHTGRAPGPECSLTTWLRITTSITALVSTDTFLGSSTKGLTTPLRPSHIAPSMPRTYALQCRVTHSLRREWALRLSSGSHALVQADRVFVEFIPAG